MGQDFKREERDFVEETIAEGPRGERGDEELIDVSDVTKMGDSIYFSKKEVFKNSTKTGHMCDVR